MLAPFAAVVLLLALWELVVRSGIVSETSIPPATGALGELFNLFGDSAFWAAVGQTLEG